MIETFKYALKKRTDYSYMNVLQGPYKNLGILSGPTHAEEIAKGKLSYLTVGSSNDEISVVCFLIYET